MTGVEGSQGQTFSDMDACLGVLIKGGKLDRCGNAKKMTVAIHKTLN